MNTGSRVLILKGAFRGLAGVVIALGQDFADVAITGTGLQLCYPLGELRALLSDL